MVDICIERAANKHISCIMWAAIKTSRRIFHRMESYVQFRVALSLHVLLCKRHHMLIFRIDQSV